MFDLRHSKGTFDAASRRHFLPSRYQTPQTVFLDVDSRGAAHDLLSAACRAAVRGRRDLAIPFIEAACDLCQGPPTR